MMHMDNFLKIGTPTRNNVEYYYLAKKKYIAAYLTC